MRQSSREFILYCQESESRNYAKSHSRKELLNKREEKYATILKEWLNPSEDGWSMGV